MNEKIFLTAVSLLCEVASALEPIEAQMYAEACERAWAGQEQLRQVRK